MAVYVVFRSSSADNMACTPAFVQMSAHPAVALGRNLYGAMVTVSPHCDVRVWVMEWNPAQPLSAASDMAWDGHGQPITSHSLWDSVRDAEEDLRPSVVRCDYPIPSAPHLGYNPIPYQRKWFNLEECV